MKEGWKVVKLGDCCNIDYGTRVVRSRDGGSKYPVYGGGGATFMMDSYNREDCMIISRFAMSEQCTRFVHGKFFLNDSGLSLSTKVRDLSQVFLNWQVLFLNDTIYKLGRGAAQKNLDTKAFANLEISYPSKIEEQQRIVGILDAAFEKIDVLKAYAEKNLENAKALFQQSLAKELEPKEGWEEKKLGDVADFIRGPFGGSLTKNMFKEKGYAIYEQQHAIHHHTNIRYFIDDSKFEEMKRFSVKPGDLIMSCSGTIGEVFIIPSNAPIGIINQALLKLSVYKDLNRHYFKYWLESPIFKNIIMKYSKGAAIANVPSVKIMKDICINLPLYDEQQKIVSTLDDISAKCRRLEKVAQKTIVDCDALKQSILRQAFNGEL